MGYKVAVVGATGAVGREMLRTLAEREFPVDKVFALASENSVGKEVSYGEDDILSVQSVDTFDFANADIALFSAGSELTKELGPKAGAAGCVVIDNSSAFRMDEDVPLIVPEVNGHVLESFSRIRIAATLLLTPIVQPPKWLLPLNHFMRPMGLNGLLYQHIKRFQVLAIRQWMSYLNKHAGFLLMISKSRKISPRKLHLT